MARTQVYFRDPSLWPRIRMAAGGPRAASAWLAEAAEQRLAREAASTRGVRHGDLCLAGYHDLCKGDSGCGCSCHATIP